MTSTEHTFTSWDGTPIFYRAWLPDAPATRALLLFHRGHEHSARWQETVEKLGLSDTACFAWDQRGHGKSPGERGDAPNMATLTKDCQSFAAHLKPTHGVVPERTVIVAASVGAVIASAWVHDFAPPIAGMVLAAPAFRVKLYVPMAVPGLRLLQKFRPGSKIKSYVKSKMLTHDPAQAAAYDADPLIFRQISVRMLLDLHDIGSRLLADAGTILTPTLILTADRDWVVKDSAQKQFFSRLGSPVKQLDFFPRSFHSLFHEANRSQVVDRTREFVQACFEAPAQSGPLLNADKGGSTRTEYDLLRAPGAVYWAVIRGGLKTFGNLSRGISLGWKTGFDSGLTLDCIYENKPAGVTPLGKIIDYFYLNAVGWRGIRIRRENLQRCLGVAIGQLQSAGKPAQILDIACGAGRYVLETMHRLSEVPINATLRDYQQPNLDAARQLAEQLGLRTVLFDRADAFDQQSLAAISPRPTLAIASGIYELFPDNAPVLRSLRGIADAMDAGGLLLYTCQPWHPQMEFIARVLINREGQPWIMRRRSQAEMDQLVTAAGFEKLEQDIDPWGIFTVSIARRVMR